MRVISDSAPRRGVYSRRAVLIGVACALLLAGCTASQLKRNHGPAVMQDGKGPPEAELLYELLVGEIAGQRGAMDLSAENYLRAARHSEDPRIAERAARIAVYAGDKERALQAALRWMELAPEESEARQVTAIMYLRNGRVKEAIPLLEQVRRNHADQPQKGFMFIAQLLGRERDRQPALQAMAGLAEKHPGDPDAMFAHAHLALAAEQYAIAHQLLDRVLAQRPGWGDAYALRAAVYQRQGDVEEALAAYREAIRLDPENLQTALSYARLLVQESRFAEARKEFKRLERMSPDDPDVLFALGLLAIQGEQLPEAHDYFMNLVEHGQRVADASFFLGRIAEMRQDDSTAMRWYHKVNGGGYHYDARLRIAILTAREGDTDGARQLLEELLQDNPAQEVRTILVEADILRLAERHGEAFDLLGRALRRYPDNPELLYAQAMAAERLDRLDMVERNLRKMLQADPNNAQALNALGFTLADRTDRYDEAYRYIGRALELEPEDAAIQDSMGWVLYRMGRHEEAIRYLRKALDNEWDAEIAAHLVEVLWVSGKRAEARKLWEEASRKAPDDPGLRDVGQRYLQ
ncbi:MAG TPA: tetratricopeptide repeat protein [Gammaproteobacteria bacterium]|nr:tetratricopeptide repeat protein [Gammaproteobacteria bacterium]